MVDGTIKMVRSPLCVNGAVGGGVEWIEKQRQ